MLRQGAPKFGSLQTITGGGGVEVAVITGATTALPTTEGIAVTGVELKALTAVSKTVIRSLRRVSASGNPCTSPTVWVTPCFLLVILSLISAGRVLRYLFRAFEDKRASELGVVEPSA